MAFGTCFWLCFPTCLIVVQEHEHELEWLQNPSETVVAEFAVSNRRYYWMLCQCQGQGELGALPAALGTVLEAILNAKHTIRSTGSRNLFLCSLRVVLCSVAGTSTLHRISLFTQSCQSLCPVFHSPGKIHIHI